MKKNLMLPMLFGVCLSVLLLAPNAYAATIVAQGGCGDDRITTTESNLQWTLDSDGKLRISGSGAMSTRSPWKEYLSSLKSLIIEEGVTTISANAFSGCTGFNGRLVIPNSVITIGRGAFSGCESLTGVELPSGLQTLDDFMFCDCKSLMEIELPSGLTSIGSYAFTKCENLSSVIFPASLTSIGGGAFSSTNIQEIHIPSLHDWLEISFGGIAANPLKGSLCEGSLYINGALSTDIVIPEGVTEIGDYAFSGYSKLKSVRFPGTLIRFGNNAFSYCNGLTSIEIPYRVATLDGEAFSHCDSLDSIRLPDRLDNLGDAFTYCSALTEITLPDNLKTIKGAFSGCSNLQTIHFPQSLSVIGDNAFSNCGMQQLTIPGSATIIDKQAFSSCTNLSRLTMLEGVTTIGEAAFSHCSALEQIEFPNSLRYIEWHTFEECTSLLEIVFPENLLSIGGDAFSECEKLKKITFMGPAPLSLASSAFSLVTANVYYSENSATWSAESIDKFNRESWGNLTWIPFDGTSQDVVSVAGSCGDKLIWTLSTEGTLTISGYGYMYDNVPWEKFHNSVKKLVIENGVLGVCDEAFGSCAELEHATLPNSLVKLGKNAFDGCLNLADIKLPDGLTEIPERCFYCCWNLKSITIPKSVSKIGKQAFAMSGLETIVIPETVKELGESAFSSCAKLQEAVLPKNITEIPNGIFFDCDALSSVRFSKTATKIGVHAFRDCDALRNITIPATVSYIGIDAFRECNLTSMDFEGSCPECPNGFLTDGSAVIYYKYRNLWSKYTGSNTFSGGSVTWIYNGNETTSLDRCSFSLGKYSYTYSGNLNKPTVNGTYGVKRLAEGTDYTVSYSNNVNVGTATVTVTGRGQYSGSVKLDFIINKAAGKLSFSYSALTKSVSDPAFINTLAQNSPGSVAYSSTNTAVAAVNASSGLVTVKSAGTTTIKAALSATQNYTACIASYSLTVSPKKIVKQLTLSDLSYSFGNNNAAYGYPYYYRIPLIRYQRFFSPVVAKSYYLQAGTWGGNCYGMAVTSGLFNRDDIQLADFGAGSVGLLRPSTYSASLGMNITALIEYAFVSQYHSMVQNCYRYYTDLNTLCAEVEKVAQTGMPVMIGVFGPEGGHALLGYEIKKISASTSYLYLYDCNFPNRTRYITLTTNSSGKYTGWYYKLNDTYNWGSNYRGCKIAYVPYSVYQNVWSQGKISMTSNLLAVGMEDFSILNAAGDEVARMDDGVFKSELPDVFEALLTDVNTEDNIIYLPEGSYSIVNNSSGDLDFTMASEDRSADVVTAAESARIDVRSGADNVVYLNGDEGDEYSVTLNEESVPGGVYFLSMCNNGETARETLTASSAPEDPLIDSITVAGSVEDDTVQIGKSGKELLLANCTELNIWIGNELVVASSNAKKIEDCSIKLDYTKCHFDGSSKEPAVQVYDGTKLLQNDVDYTVEYYNNTNIGRASVGVFGKGVYSGRIYMDFEIFEAGVDLCGDEHQWDGCTIIKRPSYTETGICQYNCTICGKTKSEEIHNYDFHAGECSPHGASFVLTNNTAYTVNGTFCAAAYDARGKLLKMEVNTILLKKDGTTELHIDVSGAYKYKTFLLENNTWQPLCEAREFK